MLTVKHINDHGFEQVFPATLVATRGADALFPYVNVVECFGAPEGAQTLKGGTVYVMNDAGKTVAKYDLGSFGVQASQHPNDPNIYSGQTQFLNTKAAEALLAEGVQSQMRADARAPSETKRASI